MKWNMIVGALVLGLGLCSQSYGFNLLDSMLGAHGGGCGCEASCGCEAVDPGCGCEAAGCASACEPACGCEAACEPACGCAAPACGSCCKKKRCCGGLGLLDIFKCNRGCCKKSCAPACEPACGCEAAGCASACEPACGCEAAGCAAACEPACGCAASCCKKSRCKKNRCCRKGLFDGLHGLFDRPCKKCCKSSCCAPACGCEASCGCAVNGCGASMMEAAPAPADEAVPMPPAPMADPSASLPNQRRVSAAAFTR